MAAWWVEHFIHSEKGLQYLYSGSIVMILLIRYDTFPGQFKSLKYGAKWYTQSSRNPINSKAFFLSTSEEKVLWN